MSFDSHICLIETKQLKIVELAEINQLGYSTMVESITSYCHYCKGKLLLAQELSNGFHQSCFDEIASFQTKLEHVPGLEFDDFSLFKEKFDFSKLPDLDQQSRSLVLLSEYLSFKRLDFITRMVIIGRFLSL